MVLTKVRPLSLKGTSPSERYFWGKVLTLMGNTGMTADEAIEKVKERTKAGEDLRFCYSEC